MKRSALMWAIAALVPITANAACVIEPLEPELQAAETLYVGTVVRSALIPSLDQLLHRPAPRHQRRQGQAHRDGGPARVTGGSRLHRRWHAAQQRQRGLQSGQGRAEETRRHISAAIATHLGIEVPVIVVSAKELALIVRENPFASADDPSRLLVAFVADAGMLSAMSAIEPHVVAPEQFHVGTHAAYLHRASGILKERRPKASGKAATTRNWATVLKLQALVDKIDA